MLGTMGWHASLLACLDTVSRLLHAFWRWLSPWPCMAICGLGGACIFYSIPFYFPSLCVPVILGVTIIWVHSMLWANLGGPRLEVSGAHFLEALGSLAVYGLL